MDTTMSPAEVARDFHFVLEVMEESHHVGLYNEHAWLLREILQRRIDEAHDAFSQTPKTKRSIDFFPGLQ